jgi:hypothetical protein
MAKNRTENWLRFTDPRFRAAVALVGVLAIVLFAVGSTSDLGAFATMFASALVFALASAAVGTLVGFIFGVPRTLAAEHQAASRNAGVSEGSDISANTNLEQVSDWLTKVLIGATLVQLSNIPSAAASLFSAMAPALGGQSNSAAFAGGIVIYFSILGFGAGWLNTRLFLGRAMREADAYRLRRRAADELLTRAANEPDRDEAETMRTQAQELVNSEVSRPTTTTE